MSRLAMHVELSSHQPIEWQGDAVAVGIYDGGVAQKALAQLGERLVALVEQALKGGWFKGKSDEILLLPVPADAPLQVGRIVLVGLGKPEKITAESLRSLAGRMVDVCNRSNITSLLMLPALEKFKEVKGVDILEAMAEGVWLADYRFDHYRSDKSELTQRILNLVVLPVRDKISQQAATVLDHTRRVVNGVYLTRDVANQPANRMTPEDLAQVAREVAHKHSLHVTVLDEEKLAEKGMHALLGVGQGSCHPPRLIILEYRGAGDKAPLAVVGKAVTFDAGGISLKPAGKMHEMKYDMCGGAAVLGFMQAIADLKAPVNVVGIIPAAENLPSGTAQRPGDIVKTAKGLFVEIQNTDAEGRLILCDAIHYAEHFNPHTIIDLATLTGACGIALGSHASGLFVNNQRLCDALLEAGRHTGERLWQLPMFDEYQAVLKTPAADLRNIGDGQAGAIIGACFLSRFVGENRRWAHLDIAATSFDLEGKRSYSPKGATGIGVRLLCRFVLENFS
ncbi:MAG: leucyl aminopeptidase [Magnetococcales bacterium]|nr:leucyl aminopeptidase [Magnetococcales bacterium]NGZ26578.1 leucyl aminopeptidase [Magnetococcales bacterium]